VSIIEQATKRLEQLRQAGVDVPWQQPGAAPATPAAAASADATARAPRRATAAETVAEAPSTVPAAPPKASKAVELDLTNLAAALMLVPGHPHQELAAEFRGIKRPLVANLVSGAGAALPGSNLIVVTSAVPGEGKTFCAINLALSMAAEVDKTVLLVDADVLKPSVASRLGIEARAGLLDVLSNPTIDLADVLLKTNIPKFTVLPAGKPRADSAELLAGGHMKQLFDELAQRYPDRIIIVDAPPLLPTTEARTLASRAGQVVMIVDAGSTSQGVLSEAFGTLENCKNVMSILNRRSGILRNYGNGYGYGD
jgi:receptor protein-tyrosine kinase